MTGLLKIRIFPFDFHTKLCGQCGLLSKAPINVDSMMTAWLAEGGKQMFGFSKICPSALHKEKREI